MSTTVCMFSSANESFLSKADIDLRQRGVSGIEETIEEPIRKARSTGCRGMIRQLKLL